MSKCKIINMENKMVINKQIDEGKICINHQAMIELGDGAEGAIRDFVKHISRLYGLVHEFACYQNRIEQGRPIFVDVNSSDGKHALSNKVATAKGIAVSKLDYLNELAYSKGIDMPLKDAHRLSKSQKSKILLKYVESIVCSSDYGNNLPAVKTRRKRKNTGGGDDAA